MAQEYLAMKNKEKGMIAINTTVFETIAKICIEEEKDIVLSDPSYFKNAISCKMENDKLILTLNVKVHYNAKVNEVCSMLQDKIYNDVKFMTDCTMDMITVNVNGFTF